MAKGLDELADYLKAKRRGMGEFEPKPYYESDTDSLIYYFLDVSSYSKRVTRYFTVFLANEDNSLVGIEVKGLTTIMRAVENLGEVQLVKPVSVTDADGDEYDLSVIVRCALVPEQEEPVKGHEYEELESATRGVKVKRVDLANA
jgi:hypothetical protein